MSFAALAHVCWSHAVMSKSVIELLWLDLFYIFLHVFLLFEPYMTGVRFLLETLIGPLFLIALVGCMLTGVWCRKQSVSFLDLRI